MEDWKRKYLSWKRKNVTLRGLKDRYASNNGGGAKYGQGLYTAFLGNAEMARKYGKVYFVLGAIPKKPKVLNNVNFAEIFIHKIQYDYCQKNDPNFDGYSYNYFYENTTIAEQMIELGYDGLVIKGREMVNYTPDDSKIKYFENERQLIQYWEDFYENEEIIESVIKESLLLERYINLLPKDFELKKKYADVVWEILQNSYKAIGGIKGSGFNSKEDMIKNIPIWKLVKKDGEIVAASLYKDENGTRKRVASGTNQTRDGVKAFHNIAKDEFKTKRSIAEISGPVLKYFYNKFRPELLKSLTPKEEVSAIIKKETNTNIDSESPYLEMYPDLEPFFYSRKINNSDEIKVLIAK